MSEPGGGDERYAIYFVPPADSALYRFGSSVLGYDCRGGRDCGFPAGAASGWPRCVREPRVYGFHATLKPPFRLRPGTSPAELQAALKSFAVSRRPIDAGLLRLTALGNFIALVPAAPCAAIDALAADCVRVFDAFRKPMEPGERDRRAVPSLTGRQLSHLDAWGYPYVFDEFRFHMTLTGPLADTERAFAFDWLGKQWAQHEAAHPLRLDRVVLLRQAGFAFVVVAEAAFAAA